MQDYRLFDKFIGREGRALDLKKSGSYSVVDPFIEETQVFDVSNILDLMKDQKASFSLDSIDGANPPYQSCFLEWYMSKDDPYLVSRKLDRAKIGLSVIVARNLHEKLSALTNFKKIAASNSVLDRLAIFDYAANDPDLSIVTTYMMGDYSRTIVSLPMVGLGWGIFVLDKQGKVKENISIFVDLNGPYLQTVSAQVAKDRIKKGKAGSFALEDEVEMSEFVTEISKWIADSVYIALYCFQFMNCRNVIEIDCEPRALNRAERRRGERPFIKYKVLAIQPVRKVYNREDVKTEPNKVMPFHLVRGHFKTFTEDKPLFGRITGRYWWHSQARGSTEIGTVIKDYKLEGKA